QDGEERNSADVESEGKCANTSLDTTFPPPARPNGALQPRKALVNQVKTDVRSAIFPPFLLRAFLRQLDGFARHFDFRERTMASENFNDVTITIARREIHVAVNIGRLAAQCLLDQAERLDKLLPIDRTEQTQTRDAVGNRNLIRGLALIFLMDQLLHRKALLERTLLKPAARQMQSGIQARKALAKFRHDR